MSRIETIAQLEAIYDAKPSDAAIRKVATRMTPLYRKWIMSSRFMVLSTVGPGGTDGSPRGDDGPVVSELDENHLAIPDWRGNNRLDSLRNIVQDGRVSLMFMVAGSSTVVRVNGSAELRDDDALTHQFEVKGRHPKTVIVVRIAEIYTQCARAILRAGLWDRLEVSPELPSPGDILVEMTNGEFDGATYDSEWPARAKATMW